MRRIGREVLRLRIALGLLKVRSKVSKKEIGIAAERDREQLVDELVHRIMGAPESEAVILVPDRVGSAHTTRDGRWGVDEPHPAPDVTLAQH